ncbi:MAG: DUF4197 domain-containing protein [Bacteroidetes bacterium]|nr:DUF4197 domain-containing protein [Bacteroidota bacterium]
MKRYVLMAVMGLSLVSCDVLKTVATEVLTIPTSGEAASALKDALKQGFGSGVDVLSAVGGFNKNNAIRILLPDDAQKIADKLRSIGMGSQVDKVIDKLNEGAESAVATAKPIFMDAVTNMSFSDAMGILTGGNGAATNYLKQTTTTALTNAFKPKIQSALDQVGFTANWSTLVNEYNKIPFITKMNPDLNDYVTQKTLSALFNKVEEEENLIRSNPAKRTTELMKKAFAYADGQKSTTK